MRLSDLLCRWFPWLCVKPNPTPIPSPAPTPDPKPPIQTINQQFLILLNNERKNQNLSSVSIDSKLVSVAQFWSEYQANTNTLSHGDFGSRINAIYPNVYAAENVAKGKSTVQETFNQWMDDPEHYQNMMGRYTSIGLGHSVSSSNIDFWTLDLVLL